MTALAPATVAALAAGAGIPPGSVPTAVAIAWAESGLDPAAIGDRDLSERGEMSVGLWQINYRPSRDKGNAIRDPQANLDPAHNAAAMAAISGGGRNWAPWTTYTTGAYRAYMARATLAAGAPDPNPPTPQSISADQADTTGLHIPNPLAPVQGAADLVRTLLHILTTIGTRDFWIRAGKMVVGTAAIIAGLNLVSHDLWGAAGDTVATVAKIATR